MTGSALQKASASALLVLLLLPLALPASAKLMVPRDFDNVTVVLAGGWEYPGLTVRWSDEADGLWVYRADGARRLYRPEELAALRDASGREITREVVPASVLGRLAPAPGGPVVQPAPPPARDPDRRPPVTLPEIGGEAASGPSSGTADGPRDWRFLLGVEAGWGKPHDHDFLASEGGLGLGASVRLQLGGALYLAGGYDLQSLPVASPPVVWDFKRTVSGLHDSDEGFLQGFWGGLALLSPADGEQAARFYLEGGVGRYEVGNLPVYSAEDAFLGYHAGVGFLIPLGTAAALDLGARGTHVVNLDLGTGDDEHTLVAFRAGLSILAR